ncbi:MAG: hypothetical protein GXO63_02310 [Candidatus Micrarchaeota archaeon]|nr:hypothetical protein [Candidatus Micrarchaeota archaeon]
MRIIFDTNILIYSVKHKVRLEFPGAELFVTESVLAELKNLARNRGKTGRYARTALEIVKDFGVLPGSGKTDDDLLDYGSKGYAIATQDEELKRKLEKAGCKVIYLRQKKYFAGLE